ncbi:MAG: bifunctional hydroxymethylpyrimidine kinase/phosphomethylpyrimidine kinase [Lysobacteraceae bacterium]
MRDPRPISALTIAGSDSGGGAGVQADLKAFAAHRVHGLCAIAALTAQNTEGVSAVHVPPSAFLRAQVDACFADFRIGAVKLGMLASADVVRTVVDLLENHRPSFVVLDPVMVATSGARLLADDAARALRMRLLPLASVVTPNLPEAEALLGHPIPDLAAMRDAAKEFLHKGVHAVLLKGGHLDEGEQVVDVYADSHGAREIVHPRLPRQAHGTGCTLAAAIAANLCRGRSLPSACVAASDFVHRALAAGYKPGRGGLVVLDPFAAMQA